jgi:predicted amino acid dehydrogenase
VDEIQCGMGRTGTFTAAQLSGLCGDYYTFSKSLGAGLTKVSALMVSERRYQEDFGYMHGSTFAEDRLGCLMALRGLALLDRDKILETCARSGVLFLSKLRDLAVDYPDVIREVRGAGLMIGVELTSQHRSASFMLRLIAQHGMEMVNMLIAGYLLNVKQIRIAPTKTRNTIRFLPSALITAAEMDRVTAALRGVCQILRYANAGRLLRYIVAAETDQNEPVRDWRGLHPANTDVPAGDEPRVAHIGHLEDVAALLLLEPSFAEVPEMLREPLLQRLFPYSKIAVAQQMRITTATGERVHLSIIGLPLTGALFEAMMRTEERELLLHKIDEALDLARAHGCKVVGFGGYTSIVTLNCTAVAATDMALTSGNAYTAALGIEGAISAAQVRGLVLAETQMAVVGAKGNIGSICARVLAEYSPFIVLMGRNAQDEGLGEVADTLYADAWAAIQRDGTLTGLAEAIRDTHSVAALLGAEVLPENVGQVLRAQLEAEVGGQRWVRLSAQLDDLAFCPVIISCTNSARPVIYAKHLSPEVAVICDIATPKDVASEVFDVYPSIQILSGGLARLPSNLGLKLQGTRLPVDHVYGCVAETTLLGVTGYPRHFSFGEMTKAQVDYIRNLAQQHGYSIGEVSLRSLETEGGATAH